MPDVLIRNVPVPILEALKQRSERHHRSLQQELRGILEEAATPPMDRQTAAEIAASIRSRLAASGRTFSDSVDLIREDRDR